MVEDVSDEATEDEHYLAWTDLSDDGRGDRGKRGTEHPIPTGESLVQVQGYAFISRIFVKTPSHFHQHKGLFQRSASFMGIVCIVPAQLRANNFTFST